jgi:hypothetical protein
MRGWTRKLDPQLKERTLNEVFRKSPRREIAKLMIMSFIGLREPGDGVLWKCCQSGRGNTLAEPRGAAAIDIEGGRERVAGKRLRKEEKDGQLV